MEPDVAKPPARKPRENQAEESQLWRGVQSPSLSARLPRRPALRAYGREGGRGTRAGTHGCWKLAEQGWESHDGGPSYRSHGGQREPTAASDPRGGPRTALRKAKVKVQELEGEEREGQKRAGRGCAHHSGKAGHARESAPTTGKPFPGPGAQAASARRLVWGRSVRFGQPSPRHESRSTELASRGL